jgi:tetratricopeptide (TPR) repeat protein
MSSRRLLALLLGVEEAGNAMAGVTDGLLVPIVRRSLAAGFGDMASGKEMAALQRTLDEWVPSGLPDKPALCSMLYDRLCTGTQVPDISFDHFKTAFGRFVVALEEGFAQATEPQLVDPPCREFGSLNLDELSRMQAPDELLHYMVHLVTHLLDRQTISPGDADYVIDLIEKMVSAPGYLRFLAEDRKSDAIARLLNLMMVVQTSGDRTAAALNDTIVTLGLLVYNISPSEKAASALASARPSAACPDLQYHYHAIMALNYVLTGRPDQASQHAGLAGGCTVDQGMLAYITILQGCIAIGQGGAGRAAGLLEKAGDLAPDGRIRALALFYRGLVFAGNGEYENALGCFQGAGAHVTDPSDLATIHNNVGSCAAYLGDLPLAETSFAEMEKLADRMSNDSALQCRLVASSHFGALLRSKGEYAEAAGRFRQALELALQSGN